MTKNYLGKFSKHRWDRRHLCSVTFSSWADVVVGDEFLHPLYLAFVLGHGFVVHAVLKKMLLAVMNLSAVLQLEGTQGFQRPQQNLKAMESTISIFISH